MERIKTVILGLTGTTASLGSVGISWEGRAEAWLRLLTLTVGLFTAALAAYWMHRMNKVALAREALLLCENCKAGHPPPHCPLSPEDRPDDCPHKKGK